VQDRGQDEVYMRRALELARASMGLASPNPQVGCVLVRDGAVVGEGAHRYEQRDHAEVVALKQAGERARGATAYVTLEPCSHHGRTGPCADALVAAGVSRVVAATVDANPVVAGQGFERLRQAGVAVEVGIGQAEAREINDAFAWWVRTCRPLVMLKAALSADGMLAPSAERRTEGQTFWITGAEARDQVQRMRHAADAVLTGVGTVLADDPLLTDRSGGERRRKLLRVVLDSRLRTPLESRLVKSVESDVLIFCGPQAEVVRVREFEAAGVEVVRVVGVDGRLDLCVVLDVLGQRKILSVLLECGSRLNGAFLSAGLVDQAVLFTSLTELGPGSVPFAAGLSGPAELELRLQRVRRSEFGADRCVRGVLRDAWAEVG
jgi:diaminohydroxyphosphoribosylaminopyrimidine deaminase/5-amino-6-(5-phosphoribosylamino)uracil reductase